MINTSLDLNLLSLQVKGWLDVGATYISSAKTLMIPSKVFFTVKCLCPWKKWGLFNGSHCWLVMSDLHTTVPSTLFNSRQNQKKCFSIVDFLRPEKHNWCSVYTVLSFIHHTCIYQVTWIFHCFSVLWNYFPSIQTVISDIKRLV